MGQNLCPTLHAFCTTHDKMPGTFLTPLNHRKLLSWRKDRIAEVEADTRMILRALNLRALSC